VASRLPETASRIDQAGFKPGVVNVRLIGPPGVIDAALYLLNELLGDAWHPATRKPGRHAGGDELQYGTMIVLIRKER